MNRRSICFMVCLISLPLGLVLTTETRRVAQASRSEPVLPPAGAPPRRLLAPSVPAVITGTVYYTGTATGTHAVWVGAFTTTQGGPPAYSATRSGPGVYTIAGVTDGVYYIMAGMDADDSGGPPDPAIDPLGTYVYNPVTVTAGALITGADVVLLDPTLPPTGTGSISGRISYTGAISSAHNIIVAATRWGESGPPAYFTVIFGLGAYTITHVADYTYTVVAFMDRGGDMGPREPDEPIGWYDPGGDQNPDPVVVSTGNPVMGIDITLRDPYSIYLPLVLKEPLPG